MKPVDILKHLAHVCVRNPDGSLSLGTHEVQMIEKSLEEYEKFQEDSTVYYGGWCAKDVIDAGQNLGFEIPEEVAEDIISNVVNKDCEVTWDKIDFAIETYYNIEEYRIDNEVIGNYNLEEDE